MKKKGPRSIPDFSSKRKSTPEMELSQGKTRPAAMPVERNVKPQATSAKSGRRGQ